ncbi:hypothetical protein ADEAN_000564200 [Angomonas deanei]|uniref:Uncharacterized protein n=1 Tax=Angomonas deanei TaxID=59799 RepID=A0A7G2CFN3_9TRYP|nr:hypothetical protein ADEAN_000564200 [Angomonas deanei]
MSKKDYSVGHSSRFVKYITKLSEANSKEEEVDLVRTDLTKMKAELSGNSTSSFDRILEAAKEDAYYDDGDDNERKHQQNGDVEDITTRSGKKYSYKDLKLKEVVVRLLHAEMCGEHADFAHIQCVHLLPSSYFLFKKTAYVGLATCVSPESEYYYLVIAQLQKDCKSDNYIEVAGGADGGGTVSARGTQ